MNDEPIEKLLRRGAVLKAPAGLLEDLIADIRLPRATAERTVWNAPPSWFKRWMPAISLAAIFLACLVAIAVQMNTLSELTRQNESLRAANQPLEVLRQENGEYRRLSSENAELGRLRKDNAEVQKLRAEEAQLKSQVQTLETLRAENKRLQADAVAQSAAGTATNGDFLADANANSERIQCVNNLKQLGLAGRICAADNNEVYPLNFISMTNEMNTWKILQCPSDTAHKVTSWADVASGNVSYLMLTPGIAETEDPHTVVIECPIHHNIGLLDGSVQSLSPNAYQTKVRIVNGRKVFP